MIASLSETCKLNQIEPHTHLPRVLTATVKGPEQKDIGQLIPWSPKG
ncbi:transposase domain-containing protein [Roseobacter fucihabitans]|nr:transposase domain-containing protein [Roseobacter litoralis]